MFKQNCFIKNSSQELRKKLIEMGYSFRPRRYCPDRIWDLEMYDEEVIDAYIVAGEKEFWIALDKESLPSKFLKYIDCGANEDLFLALAALADHTDKNQWYICQEEFISTHTMELVKKGTWQKSIISYLSYGQKRLWRKATVIELIEKFTSEDLKCKTGDSLPSKDREYSRANLLNN